MSQSLSFVDLWAKIEAGLVEWTVTDSKRDAPGTKRRFLSARDTSGNIIMCLGDPCNEPGSNPRIANQPGPSKRNPTSKVYNALFQLDGAEAEAMLKVWEWMVESAHRDRVFGPAYDTVDKVRRVLSLPFTKPDDTGRGETGVWVSWQMEAPKGIESLRTKFMVSKFVEAASGAAARIPKIIRQYDGARIARDTHACCLFELGEFKEWDGQFRGSALGRTVLVDESCALADDAPMPAPAVRAKTGYAFPYNGGHIVYGTDEFPTPVWKPDGEVDVAKYKAFMTILQFHDMYAAGKAALTAVDIGGATRYFYNVEGVKGNPLIVEGSLADAEEVQPFLMKTPAPHKDSVDSTSFGALTAITDPEHADAYSAVSLMKLQQIFDRKIVGTGKKYDTVDKISGEVALAGTEPEKEGEHFFLWQKFNMEAPKDIADLQTKFWLISAPGQPWSCTAMDGSTLSAGRRFMSGYEMSELKRATGKWREVLYTKVVFVCNQAAQPMKAVSWGGQTLDLEAAEEDDGAAPESAVKRARVDA